MTVAFAIEPLRNIEIFPFIGNDNISKMIW